MAVTPPLIKHLDRLARSKFVHVPDDLRRGTWLSHADAVRQEKMWAGDSDDLAATVLDLLEQEGASTNRLWRALVASYGSDTMDHMIALARDDDGRLWVLGDTTGPAYPVELMLHGLVYTSRVSEGDTWRHAQLSTG